MHKYEQNLCDYFKQGRPITDILDICSQLISALQTLHETGHVYNDLKLENIMINQTKDQPPQVKLIDYGLISKYQDEDGNHIRKQSAESFVGNLIFASVSALEFNQTSRKDDLVSLCYLIIYILNGGKLPNINLAQPS